MKSFLAIIVVLIPAGLFGIGSFQVGFYTGLSPDINNLYADHYVDAGDAASGAQNTQRSRRDQILYYDNLIAQAVGGGATGAPVGYPLGLTAGLDLRYNLNNLFLRMAFDYNFLLLNKTGSLKTTTYNDEITYNSWNFSFPLTFGIAHKLGEFFQFTMGAGPYMSMAEISVTHSDPKAFEEAAYSTSVSTPYKSQSISGALFGYHVLLGVQVPLVEKRVYLSFDYMYFHARSAGIAIKGTDKNGSTINDTVGDTLYQNGHKFLLGVQYQIGI